MHNQFHFLVAFISLAVLGLPRCECRFHCEVRNFGIEFRERDCDYKVSIYCDPKGQTPFSSNHNQVNTLQFCQKACKPIYPDHEDCKYIGYTFPNPYDIDDEREYPRRMIPRIIDEERSRRAAQAVQKPQVMGFPAQNPQPANLVPARPPPPLPKKQPQAPVPHRPAPVLSQTENEVSGQGKLSGSERAQEILKFIESESQQARLKRFSGAEIDTEDNYDENEDAESVEEDTDGDIGGEYENNSDEDDDNDGDDDEENKSVEDSANKFMKKLRILTQAHEEESEEKSSEDDTKQKSAVDRPDLDVWIHGNWELTGAERENDYSPSYIDEQGEYFDEDFELSVATDEGHSFHSQSFILFLLALFFGAAVKLWRKRNSVAASYEPLIEDQQEI